MDGFATTAPVATFRPNPFGLHNVHGNVFEWCLETAEDYDVPVRAGDGLREPERAQHRVFRGGRLPVECRDLPLAAAQLGDGGLRRPWGCGRRGR